ncbi:MAG: bacteriohemerythrin [Anaeromyxobacteraceae bacterium]
MQETHVWNARLDLEHGALDQEHHLQIAMIGALTEAIEQRRPWMARRLAEQLETYSAAHFASEQLMMETSEYPRVAAHAGEHEALLKRVAELREELEGEEMDPALAAALDLLSAIGAHITSSDRAFSEHTASRRGGAPVKA